MDARERRRRKRSNSCADSSPRSAGEAIGLYHASPRDPVWEYVLSTAQADECIDVMDASASAQSDTRTWRCDSRAPMRDVDGRQVEGGTELDISESEWLINPGSVGQPRDGDPRAAWLLLDTEHWTARWNRVEYPIDEAAQAIEQAGLPRSLGDRLYVGQ